MRSFIAKALLSLPGKHLVPLLKEKFGRQIFGHWTDWVGKSRDKKNKQETEKEKEKRRNNEPVPNRSTVSKTL